MKKQFIIAVIAILVLVGLGWVWAEKTTPEKKISGLDWRNSAEWLPKTGGATTTETYRNDEFKFSFSYPENIKVGGIIVLTEEERSKYQNPPDWVFQMTLAPGMESGATLTIEVTTKKSIDEITEDEIKRFTDFSPFTKKIVRQERTEIDSNPAIEITLTDQTSTIAQNSDPQESKQFIVIRNGKIYSFFAIDSIYSSIKPSFVFLP